MSCIQLDAKNSPLALLAQTCSSIGKDPTPPLGASSSHKPNPGGAKESSSIGTHQHHHNHHGKDDRVRPKSESPQLRADDHRTTTTAKCPGRDRLKDTARPVPSGSTSGKGQSPPKAGSRAKDLSDRLSPVDGIALPSRSLIRDGVSGKPTAAAAVVSSSSIGGSLVSSSSSSGKPGATSLPSSFFDVGADSVQRFAALHQQLSLAVAAAAAAGRGSLYGPGPVPPLFPLDHHSFAGAAAPTTPALYPAGLLGTGPFPLFGPQMDPVQLQQLYAAAVAQSPSLYADYAARLKAATSSTACKDPFCVRCPLGAPGCGAASSVPSTGADKHPGGSGTSLLPSAGAAGSAMLGPPLPFLPVASSLHALLLQQMSAAAAAAATSGGSSATGDPLSGTAAPSSAGGCSYTCSWVDGAADFCGMRFNSSDELLQHLRVHASAADPSGASLPPHPAAIAALTASFPLGLGSSLPRFSPTSLGDVAPPTSASAFGPMSHGFSPSSSRYHPYKSPPAAAPAFSSPGGVPSLAAGLPGAPPGAPPLLPPALAAFYSPYAALYGHRLGAAAVGP